MFGMPENKTRSQDAKGSEMIKYRTGIFVKLIEPVEVIKETPKMVTILVRGENSTSGEYWSREYKYLKHSDYIQFHDSWREAKEFLVSKANQKIDGHRTAIAVAEAKIQAIEALEEPK